jgi:polyisoprenoid-binding protein YceI
MGIGDEGGLGHNDWNDARMYRTITRFLGIICALALATAVPAGADTIVGDQAHSSAEFVVTHLAISSVHGTIPIVSSQATVDSHFIPQSIEAKLDATAIDTHDADRDKDLRSSSWFNVAMYPTIDFRSTKIIPSSDGKFEVLGNLMIHGVSKPVTLDAKFLGSVVDGRGHTHAGYTATTTVDRRDFGLNWGKTTPAGQLVVANEVGINLNFEGILQK